MSSPAFAQFEKHIEKLKTAFIVHRADPLSYSTEDHYRALAFRVLASAALEDVIERMCTKSAEKGVDNLRVGKQNTVGRSLLLWSYFQTSRRSFLTDSVPIREADFNASSTICDDVLREYKKIVTKNHGINSEKFLGLVRPLGLRSEHISPRLLDKLTEQADRRNPPSHAIVRHQHVPTTEYVAIFDLFDALKQLQADLDSLTEEKPV